MCPRGIARKPLSFPQEITLWTHSKEWRPVSVNMAFFSAETKLPSKTANRLP